jgi:hypothetical protein
MPNKSTRRATFRRVACVTLLAALAAPPLLLSGCSSASSGHAPGVAGGETLVPVTTNYPMVYVRRPFPAQDIAVTDLITSTTGGDLYLRSEASAAGLETNLTAPITGGKGDVRDPDVSPDGTKVVFSLRLPLKPNLKNDDPKQPNWHLYVYDVLAKSVTQLTSDAIQAGHDISPRYLPDGRIVFSSTRQIATQSILLAEGRPQYAAQTDDRSSPIFLLHVMNGDGSGIHQITFNTNHDFAPSVLNNGQIVFSRWNTVGGTTVSLYRCNPDGTGLELLYGANSHATGANLAGTNNNVIQFLGARQRADGKILAIDRPLQGTQLGGDTLLIDADNFVEIHQPTLANAGATGPGQVSATLLGVTTDAGKPSLGGRFASAYPLYDGTNRMLVSWSPCLVLDTTVTPAATNVCTTANTSGTGVTLAPPQYTLWLFDFAQGTLSPVLAAQSGMMTLDAVVLQPRKPAATFIPDLTSTTLTQTQQNLVAAGVGLLNIASVYDFDGVDTAVAGIEATADPAQPAFAARPYRFIRIVKAVEIPSNKVRKISDTAFGPAGMGMREILGYAPIQPDGSVQVQVPANVPFTIDILDANARRITARHESWLQVLPGETKQCNGCHVASQTSATPSHGRSNLTRSVNAGALTAGQPFPSTNPALLAGSAGETMAATLAAATCGSSLKSQSAATCSQVLSTDVTYTPVWTTGTTLPAGTTDPIISYPYGVDSTTAAQVGLSEPPPTNGNCSPWTAQCRVTIHYANASASAPLSLQHIWDLNPRTQVGAAAGSPNIACELCHTAVAGKAFQVPAGQLDLTGTDMTLVATVLNSYELLLFPHDEQTLNMGGTLSNVLVPAPGPPDPVTGLPTTIMVPVSLAPPMTAGSAAGSGAFLDIFDGTRISPTVDHRGYLTPAELRLISEWLDIGAQYYNDPFVAPVAN